MSAADLGGLRCELVTGNGSLTNSPPAGSQGWKRGIFSFPALRIVRFSGAALTEGVETHVIEGVPVRLYSAAKTVADCFKYRNKIGTSVAVEALRDAWRERKATADELWRYAKVCRVQNVMRPYLEAVV